jgi:hypothetical protein
MSKGLKELRVVAEGLEDVAQMAMADQQREWYI